MDTVGSNCSVPASEYQYWMFPIVYSMVLLVGLPGNLVALFVFTFKITPRTSTNVYIINLALADTGILCTLPFRIHYYINKNSWVFGDAACLATGILFYANIYMSVAFMTCICVDRYVATIHPHTYLRLRNSCCSVGVSVVLWAVCVVVVLTFVLMGPLETKDTEGSLGHSCFENLAQDEWDRRLAPYILLGLIGSLLPSGIILVCYPLAARRISLIRTITSRRAQRVIYTLLAITLLCFFPYHVVGFLHLLLRQGFIEHCSAANAIHIAKRVTTAMVTLNTCLDPLLYYAITNHCKWKPLKLKWMWGRLGRARGVYTISTS